MEKKTAKDNGSSWRFFSLGVQLAAVFVVCIVGGVWLDETLDTNQSFTAGGIVVGFLYLIYYALLESGFFKRWKK